MSPKHSRIIQHVQAVNKINSTINFAKDMINKCQLERQRGVSGAGLKSLSIEKAIIHTTKQLDRLTTALNASEKLTDSGKPGEFDNYMKLSDWVELTARQLNNLKTSQRKRVNVYEFSYELMDEIKAQTSIVDMVDELKIRKKRSGGDRYVICCPFHDEKTPSCMIYASEDKFHCFGCEAHGDLIDFYQLYNDLEFDEAIMRLCDRLEIQILDADQVEKVDEKLDFYRTLLASAESDLEEENIKFVNNIKEKLT